MLRTVTASTYIKVPRPLAFGILAGYEAYRSWVPDVLESRTLVAEGDVAVAELVAPTLGSGKLILEFVQSDDAWLMFNQVDRYRRAGLAGRWDLEDADGGAGVVVRASLSSFTHFFDLRARRRLRRFLERTLDALASRSHRLAAHGGANGGAGRRKIFELVRDGDSLRIEFGDAVYELGRRRQGESS